MSQSRLEELLSADLDGALGPDEQAELLGLLDRDENADSIRQAYTELDRLLRDLPELKPPSSLHERVVSGVRLPDVVSSPSGPSWLTSWLFTRPAGYGLAAAAGVLLTVAMYNASGPETTEAPTADMLGSMVPQPGQHAGRVIDRQRLGRAGSAGDIALTQLDEQLMLSIILDAEKPVEIAVNFEGTGIRFDTVSPTADELDAVTYVDPVLRVRSRGRRQIQIFLGREDVAAPANAADIMLEFSSTGQQPETGSLKSVH